MKLAKQTGPHAYDANLGAGSALQDFFEENSLSVATRFFRNEEIFQELEEDVIPALLRDGLADRGILRVWSAGCSDGRETYSLALACRRILDKLGQGDIKLLVRGSDLSRPQVTLAQKGAYRLNSGDRQVLEPFSHAFVELEPAVWQIKPTTQEEIEFVVEDITKVKPKKPYDLLICSLVVLYYQPAYQKKIIQHLVSTVRLGGFFHIVPINRRWMRSQGYEPLHKIGPFYRRNRMD